jgi:hypothetical protein
MARTTNISMSNQTPEKVRQTSFDIHAYGTALATINDLREQLTQSEANQAVMREALDSARREVDNKARELIEHREKAHGNYWAWQVISAVQLKALLDKVERLTKALEFYADEKDWQGFVATNDCYLSGEHVQEGETFMAFGKGEDHPWTVARDALKEDGK